MSKQEVGLIHLRHRPGTYWIASPGTILGYIERVNHRHWRALVDTSAGRKIVVVGRATSKHKALEDFLAWRDQEPV